MQSSYFFVFLLAVFFGILVVNLELAFFWPWSILAGVWAPWKAALGARPATQFQERGARFLKI